MGILFPLAIIVVIVLIKLAKDSEKRVGNAWIAAADRLGLDYAAGSLMKKPLMSGRFEGKDVEVGTYTQSSGKSSATFTRYRIRHAKPLGLGLKLSPQGFFSGVAGMLGAQDIDTGDETFDSKVVVKGRDAAGIVRYLTPERRRVVLRLLSNYPRVRVDDTGLEWSARGKARETEKIVNTVLDLSSAATELGLLANAPAAGADRLPAAAVTATAAAAALATAAAGVASTAKTGALPDAEFEAELASVVAGTDYTAEAETAPVAELPFRRRAAPSAREAAPEAAPEPASVGTVTAAAATEGDESTAKAEASVTEAAGSETARTPAESADPLAVERICAKLFAPSVMSTEARKLFDADYKGQRVRWTGNLRRATPYRIDIVFKDGAGTKATFALPVEGDGAFGRTVQAIVQLPPEAADELRRHIGKELSFEGRLAGFDPLIRHFQIAAGRIV